jgi:outer membrane protein OmpA-like peptidoglycan-associated protein
MDIYFTELLNTDWTTPVGLDIPINSKGNDFGLITDSVMSEGYFSSDRNKPMDIYHFKTNFPQVFYSAVQKDNHYNFIFRDTNAIVVDTTNLKYVWNFGDGNSADKMIASHCYKGPGNYRVSLDIIDKRSEKRFFSKLSYNLKIVDFEQPFISSANSSVKGEMIGFSGSDSYLPGFRILNYSWNFGDGSRSSGQIVKHVYSAKGEYMVNLGVTLQSVSTGKIIKTGISKKILVLNDNNEKIAYLVNESPISDFKEPQASENAIVTDRYSSESDFRKESVFVVEFLSLKTPLNSDNNLFNTIPKKFRINEEYNPEDSLYSYYVDQQINLMASYPAYRELTSLGYKNVCVKMNILKDQSEKDLHTLIMVNGAFADTYFDNSEKLTSGAFIMLDQIFKLMKKYPDMKLEFAVHTDNTGLAENNLALSQRHSQSLVNNLIHRGISTKRMIATGFGGSKPIASNYLEKDRKLNRRIDFTIIK